MKHSSAKKMAKTALVSGVLSCMLVTVAGFTYKNLNAPIIDVDEMSVLYGETPEATDFLITDDEDDFEDLNVVIDLSNFNAYELATSSVEVTATDTDGNSSTKTVAVTVVDKQAPAVYPVVGEDNTAYVKLGGDTELGNYVKAYDDVDGDLTSYIEASDDLDTSKAGKQTITLNVTDNSGNEAEEEFTFVVTDDESLLNKTTATTAVAVKSSKLAVHSAKKAKKVASTAISRIGCKYRSGKTGPNAFDCSGLTYYCAKKAGISIPRTACAQYNATTRVSKSKLRAGDLVFFSNSSSSLGHAGVYVGNGYFVHAAITKYGVIKSKLSGKWYKKHYVGAGRI